MYPKEKAAAATAAPTPKNGLFHYIPTLPPTVLAGKVFRTYFLIFTRFSTTRSSLISFEYLKA
jgi:ABC-type Na+ efflux pump permease subunit